MAVPKQKSNFLSILSLGIPIESFDKNGNTLFMCILSSKKITKRKKRKLIKEFINSGVNLNAVNDRGDTVLHIAVNGTVQGYVSNKSVRMIVKHGAITSVLNKDGLRPRDIAYKGLEPNLGNFLLFSDALPTTRVSRQPIPSNKCTEKRLSSVNQIRTPPTSEKRGSTHSSLVKQNCTSLPSEKQNSISSLPEKQRSTSLSSEKEFSTPPSSEIQRPTSPSSGKQNLTSPLSKKQNSISPSIGKQNSTSSSSEKQILSSPTSEKQKSTSPSSEQKKSASLDCSHEDIDELECLICFFKFKPTDFIYKCCYCHKAYCKDCKKHEIMSHCPFCRRDISKNICRDLDLEKKVELASKTVLCDQ